MDSRYKQDQGDLDAARLIQTLREGPNAPETYTGAHVLLSAQLRTGSGLAATAHGPWSKQMLDALFEEVE